MKLLVVITCLNESRTIGTRRKIKKLSVLAESSFLTMEAQMYRFKYQIN